MFAPPSDDENSLSDEDVIAMLQKRLDQGLSRRDAVKDVCQTSGIAKSRVYDLMLSLGDTS